MALVPAIPTIDGIPTELRQIVFNYLNPMEQFSLGEAVPIYDRFISTHVVPTTNFVYLTGYKTCVIALSEVDWVIPTRSAFSKWVLWEERCKVTANCIYMHCRGPLYVALPNTYQWMGLHYSYTELSHDMQGTVCTF